MKFTWIVPTLVALVGSLPHSLVMAAGEPSKENLVFVGTYTGGKSKGIYSARFNPHSGELSTPKLAAETKNPTFLAVGPNQKFLYAANEVSDFGVISLGYGGRAVAFRTSKPRLNRWKKFNAVLTGGRDERLPDTYGMAAEDLVQLMNSWRHSATDSVG